MSQPSVPMINIAGDPNDLNYRYKMPQMILKVEGRGNGIKTKVVNMADVASALGRNPAHTTKWFGCELGALTKVNPKLNEFYVNGKHDDLAAMTTLLFKFIEKYVLCAKCRNPETEIVIKKKEVHARCIACGWQGPFDNVHKMSTIMVTDAAKAAGGGGGGKTKAKGGKSMDKDKPDALAKPADAKAAEKKDELKDKKPKPRRRAEDMGDDVSWSVDTSAEAVEARRLAQLTDKLKAIAVSDEEERAKKHLETFLSTTHDDAQIIQELEYVQKELGTARLAPAALVDLLTPHLLDSKPPTTDSKPSTSADNKGLVQNMRAHKALWTGVLCGDERAQAALLGGVERALDHEPALLEGDRVPALLQWMFEAELVDEDALLRWYEKGSSLYVSEEMYQKIRGSAMRFMAAIKEMMEEEEDEEEDVQEIEAEEEGQEEDAVSKVAPKLEKTDALDGEIDDL